MAHHNTVLSQFLKIVPRHEFESLANQHDGTVRSDAMSRWTQFVALSVGHLGGRESLRDIEWTLQSQSHHQYHLGSQLVSKSALARANKHRDSQFYDSLFKKLYTYCTPTTPKHKFRFKHKLFSLDGSLIDLSMKIFPWADFNRQKSAFKLHVGLDHDGLIPAFATVTLGKGSEEAQARQWNFPKGSVLVFDKGYNSFDWHNTLTKQGLNWVTRIYTKALYRVTERRSTKNNPNVTSDQTIEYTSKLSQKRGLQPVRRIGYRDPDTNKRYVFITNNFKWSAQTIADIYKQRWQIELFFKWIKQNLKIKVFLGNTKNAVMTQIMAAMCLYLVLAYLKFQMKLTLSMQQITRLLQLNLFIRRPLSELLDLKKQSPPPDPQLRLRLDRN